MFKGLKKWIIRGFVYSVGLSAFLKFGWINPAGDWFINIISGFVLYAVAFLIPTLLVRN